MAQDLRVRCTVASINAERPANWRMKRWPDSPTQPRERRPAGRNEPALKAFADASRLSNGNSKPVSVAAYTQARIGLRNEARVALAGLQRRSQEHYVPPYALALVYAGLNEDGKAFEWLNNALSCRDVHLIYLPVDPKWDSFRKEARFQDILRRCDFETEGTQSSIA